MYVVYQLKLVQEKAYFGTTPSWRKQTRLLEHRDGGGAKWTARFPPVEHDPIVQTWNFPTRDEAYRFEEQVVKDYLMVHGIDSARGGMCNFGDVGGYRMWVPKGLRNLVPLEYNWNGNDS